MMLKTKKLIGIIGEHQIGKSSLLEQIPTFMNAGWKVCFMDFQEMRNDKFERFTEEFFEDIRKNIFEGVNSWKELLNNLKNQPVIFCFDEVGALAPIADLFIPKLYHLQSNTNNENIRIITCSPTPINTLFKKEFQVKNPKYSSNWHTIPVKPFKPEEIQQMLNLLPKFAATVAIAQCEIIIKLSSCHPLALQYLCDRLFQANQKGQTQTELIAIITNPNSYKEEC